MVRKPNEVPIAAELLQQMLALGNESRPFRVIKGPDPEARIIAARWEGDGLGSGYVVLVYDREVPEPTLQEFRIDPHLVPEGQERSPGHPHGVSGARQREFHIQIDRASFTVSQGQLTGAQLRALPTSAIGPDKDLYEIRSGSSSDLLIGDSDAVTMRDGLRFFAPPKQITAGA